MSKGKIKYYCLYFALSILLTTTGGFAIGPSVTNQDIARSSNDRSTSLYDRNRDRVQDNNLYNRPNRYYQQNGYYYYNATPYQRYNNQQNYDDSGYYNWYYSNPDDSDSDY